MTGVAFVPSTPLLIPEVASRSSTELDVLRAGCDDVVAQVLLNASRCVVVSAGEHTRTVPSPVTGGMQGFGVDVTVNYGSGNAAVIGWQASLGVSLVNRAGWSGELFVVELVEPDTGAELLRSLIQPTAAVICVGDGSAGLGVKSPGYVIEGADAFDDVVGHAIAQGDFAVLAALDLHEGARVMAEGTPVWLALGSVTPPPVSARLTQRTTPHGVSYFVGLWQF